MEPVFLVLAAIGSFFVTWFGYHLGGYLMVLDGITKKQSLEVAVIETVYIMLAAAFSILPFGWIISLCAYIIFPFFMLDLIRKKYDLRLVSGIIVFLIAVFVEAAVFAPLYFL